MVLSGWDELRDLKFAGNYEIDRYSIGDRTPGLVHGRPQRDYEIPGIPADRIATRLEPAAHRR